MDYTTQMDAARKGILTGQLRAVAVEEKMEAERLRELVAKGQAVIPANKNHVCLKPRGIGRALRTKINVNLGVSRDCLDLDEEFKKVEAAVAMGAEAIMDLSSFGDTKAFRQKLVHGCTAVLGTVPIYDAVVYYNKPLKTITSDEWIDVVRMHAQEGVDFMTIHCGINRQVLHALVSEGRVMDVVSRGGSFITGWMLHNDRENPLYEYYDEILDICAEYDVTISLGDGLRPGCLADATDRAQIQELLNLGELTQRAWQRGVQVMVEGPGHVPYNQIAANMQLQKRLCHGAPFYVLGPLVTDIAPGYDHITSAIGGTLAAVSGADFLCYVTPAEHLGLPDIDDVREGVIATRIAAHAADIAKGLPQAIAWDREMAVARKNLDWPEQIRLALDPVKAQAYRDKKNKAEDEACSMCGDYCAVKIVGQYLEAHRKKQ